MRPVQMLAGVKEPTAKVKRALALMGADHSAAAAAHQHSPWPDWVQRLTRRARSAAGLRPVGSRAEKLLHVFHARASRCK